MTITDIAAQMGVAPETLVQETIAQGTAKATAFVALGALAAVLMVAVLFIGAYLGNEFCMYPFSALLVVSMFLLCHTPDLVNWKTAPETTANQYIVEHYGGDSSGHSLG